MLMANPPDHSRLRDLAASFFSRVQIEKLRSQIEEEANQLIDDIIGRGSMDIIRDYSLPLTMGFMHQVLGIPEEERKEVFGKTLPSRRLFDPPAPLSRKEMDLENFNMQRLVDCVTGLCAKRKANPQNDLISHLLEAQNQAVLLSGQEWISQIILLLFAGMDTVPHMIGNSILTLHQHPSQLAELQSNPKIFSTALHELLRFVPPVHMTNTEATADIEISGCLVKKGKKITSLIAAGNRDPKIF
jgi:cytochrome P450